MKTSNLAIDLYKGQWALSLDSANYFFRNANDIVSGKKNILSIKAKNLIDFYDEDMAPLRANDNGTIEITQGSTAVVNMIGPIISYGDWWYYGADEIVKHLEKLNANPNITSIIIFMDGPGGSAQAISPFIDFGNTRDKNKTLGIVFEQCCSAHLYIAYGLQPDFVWAANNITSQIGSLGVMISYLDDQKWLESMGLKRVEVYPDESKDKNLPVRLALEGKYDLIKTEMLSPLAKRFQSDMVRLNPGLKSEEPGVLTGKVFYAEDAIKVGFASKIGSLAEALQYVQILSETNRYIN